MRELWRLIASNWQAMSLVGALIAAFGAVVAAVGTFAAARQQDQQRAEYERELRQRTDQLREKAEDIADLNRQLAAKSDEITRLTRQGLDTITGGNSFCTLTLADLEHPSGPRVVLTHHGDFPVYDLSLSIADSEAGLDEGRGMTLVLGTIAVGFRGEMGDSARRRFLVPGDVKEFAVGFRARNGVWRQVISLRRVDGSWKLAARAYRREGSAVKQIWAEDR